MESITTGRFLAILRKTEGLTQKEVAGRLHVSDKTVSRWERDENYPDPALLPELAVLFGVTVDELLCGERAAPPPQVPSEVAPQPPQKAPEQQTADLLRGISASFRIHVILCALLVAGGAPLAMVGIGFLMLLAVVIWIPLAYRSAKNKLLATTLLLDARQERAFSARLKVRTWQVLGSALVLPVQMGLAALGYLILNEIGRDAHPYAISLINFFLGDGFDASFHFRCVYPIFLLNLLLPFLYHRKYADVCFKDAAAQKKVRRLAMIAGSAALVYLLISFLPGLSSWEIYGRMTAKQREAVCFVIEFAPDEAASLADILKREEQVRPLPAPSETLLEKAPPVYPYLRVLTQYESIPEAGEPTGISGTRYGGLAVDREALRLYVYDYERAESGVYMLLYKLLSFAFGNVLVFLAIYGVYWGKRRRYMQPGVYLNRR